VLEGVQVHRRCIEGVRRCIGGFTIFLEMKLFFQEKAQPESNIFLAVSFAGLLEGFGVWLTVYFTL
jgi:hypothetical protein